MIDDRLVDRVGLGVLTQVVPQDLVDEVINATGAREKRARLLPTRLVVYYTLALTLFYGDAYEEVLRKLVNGLRFLRSWGAEWTVPSTGAISRARERVGSEPLKELFHRVAVPLTASGTAGSWYQGRRLMAIDGVVLDIPDTPENRERYGKSGGGANQSPFPQVRVVGLAECGTHALVAAALDSWRVYERALLERLLDAAFEPSMLILADRGFYSYELWKHAAQTGAALLWRVPATVHLPVGHVLDDGSYLSELLPRHVRTDLNRGRRRSIPDHMRIPVRVIEYRLGNRRPAEAFRLITTLLNPAESPATELAVLYAERWEFELGLDEIETHQIAGGRLLRSRKPDLVEQEIWGLLITHYAIRHLMHQVAVDIGIDEDRLSFIRSLRVVRRSVVDGPGFPPSAIE
jgi:hypothetical protein